MYLRRQQRPCVVILPDNSVLSVADLPDRNTTRWVASRKARVALAIIHGLMTREDAQARYRLTDREIDSWMRCVEKTGIDALKTTRLQSPETPRQRSRSDDPVSDEHAEV